MHARWKITGDRNKRDRQPRGVPVPGTARNRGSLRSNRAKLRASSPCRLDRRADLRNEERSEEHTSELQSLMRISYTVFCLTHKKQEHNDVIKISGNHTINRHNVLKPTADQIYV